MRFQIDREYMLDSFRKVISIPSPTGYYVELNPVLEEMAAYYPLGVIKEVSCDET